MDIILKNINNLIDRFGVPAIILSYSSSYNAETLKEEKVEGQIPVTLAVSSVISKSREENCDKMGVFTGYIKGDVSLNILNKDSTLLLFQEKKYRIEEVQAYLLPNQIAAYKLNLSEI